VVARYLYDPYGNLLSQSGSLADVNLYRFSSKEYHTASGLVYYLYRFYDPNLQRWPNRDPFQELGGINLYCFVRNQPSTRYDAYGWIDFPDSPECQAARQKVKDLEDKVNEESDESETGIPDPATVAALSAARVAAERICNKPKPPPPPPVTVPAPLCKQIRNPYRYPPGWAPPYLPPPSPAQQTVLGTEILIGILLLIFAPVGV
jgi:RHS repeat-associated protein